MSAEKLKAFVDAFDTKRADTEARAIIEAATAAGGAAGSTPASAEGLFDALCVHVSLAAMDNQPLSSLRGALATFKNAPGASSFERAAIKYVEGTAALRQTKQIARVRFQEALEEDPHFVVARLGLAVVAYQEQQWKPCITELKAVLAALGTYAPNIVRVLLGVCSLRVGEDKHARRCIKRALEVDPSDPAALLAQFAIHAHYREEADAARVVRQLHAVAPSTLVQQRVNDMFFFRNVAKGDSYVAEHDAQLAARIAKTRAEAAAAHDVAGEAYAELQLARLHHARGRLVDAVAGYERALALAPTLAAAAVHRAEALHGLGRRDDCLRQVMEALTQREKDPRLLQMATALFSTRGDHTRAVALAQTLLASAAKKTPEAWAINAWVNRLDAAEFGAASTFAAAARAKVHRAEDHALSLNAAAMSNDAAAVARVATAALGIRDIDQAIAAATAIGPREFPYFYNYALALEKSSPDRARAVYVRLVKGAPSELATYERLAHLAQRAGRGAEALKWAALLEAASPDGSAAASSSGAVLKAWVLKNHGHAEEALKVVRTAAEKHRDEALGLCTGALYLWDAASSESNKEAKLQRAMNGFFHALRHDRGNVLAAHGAACCIASQGFHAHAGVLLERVAEVDCNDEACKRNIREHRFNVLVATRAYRAAIAALPRDSALTRWQRCALALCHSSVAQHVEAVAALDVALAEHPKDATVCFYLVFALLAAAIDVVLSPKPVTQAAGAAALEYIGRALELTPYARNVKSAEQKTALRRMDVFVRKGTLEKAVRKRMEDFSREAEDLRRDEAAWRNAATQLAQERDAIAHEATQQELVRQQTRADLVAEVYTHQQRLLSQISGINMSEVIAAAERYGYTDSQQGAGEAAGNLEGFDYDTMAYLQDQEAYARAGSNGHGKRDRDDDLPHEGLESDFAVVARAVEGVPEASPLDVMHAAIAEDFNAAGGAVEGAAAAPDTGFPAASAAASAAHPLPETLVINAAATQFDPATGAAEHGS